MTSGSATPPENARHAIPLAWLALAAGLLPLLVVHICYALSVQAGHVPGCIPYIYGCTSISAAGRHGAAYFIFKAGMIPSAVLMAAYWVLCRRWLLSLGARESLATASIVALGVTGAAFLVLYTTYLGSRGDFYNLMRRYGVNVHLSFSVLAQIILTRELLRLSAAAPGLLPSGIVRAKLVLVTVLLGLGLLSIPLNNFPPYKDQVENVIEWLFTALMVGYYLLTARAWQLTGFRAEFSTRSGPAPQG